MTEKSEAGVGLAQHRRLHRPAVGGGSAVPIEECPVDVCREWVEAYPELRGEKSTSVPLVSDDE